MAEMCLQSTLQPTHSLVPPSVGTVCPRCRTQVILSRQANPLEVKQSTGIPIFRNKKQEELHLDRKGQILPSCCLFCFCLHHLVYLRLSNLSGEEFVSATLIDKSDFIDHLLQNYDVAPQQLLHLPSSKRIPCPFPIEIANSLDILSCFRLALTSQAVLYLDINKVKSNELLKWLDSISGGKVFDLPQRSGTRQQNLLWFNTQSYHTLTQWIAHQLQSTILEYYFNPRDRFLKVRQLKKYIPQENTHKVCLNALQLNLKDIKGWTPTEKAKAVETLRLFEESMRDQMQEEMLNTVVEKKKKKKRKTKKQKKEETSLGKQYQPELVEENVSDKKEGMSGMGTSEDISLLMAGLDSVQTGQMGQNDLKGQETISFQVDLCESMTTQIPSKSTNTTNMSLNRATSGLTQIEKPCQSQLQPTGDTKIDQDSFQEVRLVRNSSHDHIGSLRQIQEPLLEEQTHDSQTTTIIDIQIQDNKGKKKRKRKNQKGQTKVAQEFKSKVSSIIVNRQLNQMLDNLSVQSNSSYESKYIAFERVRYFVKSMYPGGDAILFGSNAVGLSLPTSDIDIMLIDMPCQSKEEICDCLAQIAIYINAMGWVTSCSSYFNAKVPLVKLQIDPSVSYYTPKCKQDYFPCLDPYSCYLNMKQPGKAVPIKVDITISTQGAKVSGSTELMRSHLEENSSLQRVLLALKYTLSIRGFSENFKGGIGSYCLFVMVASFFREFKESREGQDCEILLDILKFYGEQFQNQLKVVTFGTSDSKTFLTNEQTLQEYSDVSDQILYNNPLKIIDPLNGKLMSSSCYQYNLIKAEWRHIRTEIMQIQQLVQAQIESCFHQPSDISKIMANKKSMDKWAHKLQNRIDFSVADIIQRHC